MKTLEEWLKDNTEGNAYPASWEYTEYVLRDGFPKALKIIRAILQESKQPGLSLGLRLKEAAEKIINEKE